MWFCPQTVTELLRRAGFRVGKLYFVDDIQKEVVASYNYKTFVSLWKAARRLMPRRLRNTMVVVCQPS
jgi:hypothetical protein